MAKEIKKIIQVDTSEAERNIEGLTEKVKDFKKELTDTGKVTLEYTEKQKKHKEAIKENEEEEQKQIQTVKDLKKEINDLKDSLVPLTKGSDEWNSISKELIEKQTKLTDITRAAKEGVDAEAGSYNELKIRLREALEEYHKMAAGDARNAKADEVRELREELKRLDEATSQYGRNVGNYENAIRNVLNEYTSQRSELKALRVELEQLEPGTEAYNKAFMRAAEITHNLAEQQEMLKYASNDLGDQLSNIRGIAANMAAGFSAVNAAMGLFGGESKEVQQAMLKVQQAMALVQGLQGLDGFIKRTQGLSTAIKGWIAQSKAATVQTTAQATATKAAAVATNAETVATQGATVAQKGLNAAMKANPIGLILGLIAILIVNWKKLTEWLGKAVGGWDKVTKAMNKFKATVSGVANSIKKILLVPIKEAINYVTTLGKVLKDVFTLNWGEIKEDIKNGINGAVEIVKDGYDVAANYAEGKEKEMTKQAQAEIKKRAELSAKELDFAIKLAEAKEGADWKFSEEGQETYRKYFENLEQMYKDDKDKYEEYQIEKANYDRELVEHQKKEAEDKAKKDKEAKDKAVAAAKTAADKMKEIETNYQSKVASTVGTTWRQIFNENMERLSSFEKNFKQMSENLKKEAQKLKGSAKTEALDAASSIDKYFSSLYNKMKKGYENLSTERSKAEQETRAFLTTLSSGEIRLFGATLGIKDLINEKDNKVLKDKFLKLMSEMGTEGGIKLSDALYARIQIEWKRITELNQTLLQKEFLKLSDETQKQVNNELIKLFQKTIIPNVDEEIDRLEREISKKTIKLDFEIETGMDLDSYVKGDYVYIDQKASEFEKAAEVYENMKSQLQAQINHFQQTVIFAEQQGLTNSDEYKNAVNMLEKLNTQLLEVQSNYYVEQGKIRSKYFNKDLNSIQTQTDAEIRLAEKKYNEQITIQDMFSGVWPEREQAVADEIYQIKVNSLQKQMELYEQQLLEQTLTADERIETEKMVASITAQIEEEELRHTMETNQRKIDSFQAWYSVAQECVGGIANIIGGLADYYEADMEAQLKAGKITEEQADKQYENIKGMRIAEAVINTLAGSIGAYLQACSTYPPPAGPIIGAISAAAVAAAGAAQIAKIKSSTRNGSSSNTSAIATPQMQPYEPQYVQNTTGASDVDNLRNAMYEQPIYVRVSDIDSAQNGRRVRTNETSF